MSFFCLLWVPLFYLFRRCFSGEGGNGSVWALILGSVTALIQYFMGNLVNPEGFGFNRWLFGFVDIVSLPVLVSLVIYAGLQFLHGFQGGTDFANFALLWLIPVSVFRAVGWSSAGDPILLVIIPLMWTALAVGIPFLINWMTGNFNWWIAVIAILGMIILPVAAAGSYWALFSQKSLLGLLLLAVTLIPASVSLAFQILDS